MKTKKLLAWCGIFATTATVHALAQSAGAATPAVSAAAMAGATATESQTLLILGLVDGVFLFVLAVICLLLLFSDNWSLASALSDDGANAPVKPNVVPPPLPPPPGAAANLPPPPAGPAMEPVGSAPPPASSSSRLIALVGMLATVSLFLGFGNYVLWQCFRGGRVPENLSQLIWFLGGGASLFVPYALNQLRGSMEELAKLNRR